eukprot:UN03302
MSNLSQSFLTSVGVNSKQQQDNNNNNDKNNNNNSSNNNNNINPQFIDDKILHNTALHTAMNIADNILEPIIETLNERVSLQLHELPSIPASPLEFTSGTLPAANQIITTNFNGNATMSRNNKNNTSTTTLTKYGSATATGNTQQLLLHIEPKYNPLSSEYCGFLKYCHLPFFLQMPYVSMEGYLYKAYYEPVINSTTTTGGNNNQQIQQQQSSSSSSHTSSILQNIINKANKENSRS